MNPALPCLFIMVTEPTDRALAGWCPVPPNLDTPARASGFVTASQAGGCALLGDTRLARVPGQ